MARLELVGVERLDGHGDVLLLAARVGEAEVDELDFLVLDHFQHVGCGGHAKVSWDSGGRGVDAPSRVLITG